VLNRPEAILAGGIEAPGHSLIGADLGQIAGGKPLGLEVGDDAAALFRGADAVIDFTHPTALARHAGLAAEHGTALVVGTTGLEHEALSVLADAAKKTAVVRSANMSVGVTLLTTLVERLAAILGPDIFDIEITEMHHRHKIDAPSGTAFLLGRAAAEGRGVDLDKVAVRGRDGETGARAKGVIGFAALRGGDVVGDHSVIFATEGERIELTHKAASRDIFARGALRAARWAMGRAPGLYTMKDVLGV